MGVDSLSALARAVSEGLQGFQQFEFGIKPKLEEAARARAATRANFMQTIAGGPNEAFNLFGDDYLQSVRDAIGVEIPTREEDITERVLTRRQRPPRAAPTPGPFAAVPGTEETTLITREPPTEEAGPPSLADVLRSRRRLVPGAVREIPQPGLRPPGVTTPPPEEPEFEEVLEERPTGRRRRVLALPPTAREFKIQLASGETVPVSVLRGLPGEVIMHLIRGPEARGPAVVYGDLFPGNIIKPAWQNTRIVYDRSGNIRLPDAMWARERTPLDREREADLERKTQAMSTYRRVLGETGDVNQAWRAASGVDPVTFKPELSTPSDRRAIDDRQRRLQALSEFNRRVAAGVELDEAYNAAFRIDPTFPRPATLPSPRGPESPQQATWRLFFDRGYEGLNPQQRQFIDAQLSRSRTDPEMQDAFRVVSALRQRVENGTASQVEEDTFFRATRTIAEKTGIPMPEPDPATTQAPKPNWFRQQMDAITRRWTGERAPAAPAAAAPPGVVEPRAWAASAYTELQQYATQAGITIAAAFNRAREADRERARGGGQPRFTDAQWRALYELILRSGGR